MGRFLTTLPVNLGYYNLGTVEAYPTGGTGPTAYGPTSYFGSDPLPPRLGDSINNATDLGDFSSNFRTINLSGTHGGNTRIQSTFYKLALSSPRSLLITQNYSATSYQSTTNRNTIISVYKVEDGTHRRELPINDAGYVYKENSLVDGDSDDAGALSNSGYQSDYPNTSLDAGTYIILITNDIRYLQTTYSFTVGAAITDWRFVREAATTSFDFGLDTDVASSTLDFGSVVVVSGSKVGNTVSGLGYTREGVSP
jgi:hypothetical protein